MKASTFPGRPALGGLHPPLPSIETRATDQASNTLPDAAAVTAQQIQDSKSSTYLEVVWILILIPMAPTHEVGSALPQIPEHLQRGGQLALGPDSA